MQNHVLPREYNVSVSGHGGKTWIQFLSRDHHSKRPMNLPNILFVQDITWQPCSSAGDLEGVLNWKIFIPWKIVLSRTLLINLWSSLFQSKTWQYVALKLPTIQNLPTLSRSAPPNKHLYTNVLYINIYLYIHIQATYFLDSYPFQKQNLLYTPENKHVP